MAATVERDEHGVPHIAGEDERDIAAALGTCMAEDRPDAIVKCYLEAQGRAARWFGPDLLDQDFERHHWRVPQVAAHAVNQHPPEVINWIQAYCDGFNHYIADHDRQLADWVRPIEPVDVVALYFWCTISWALAVARQKLPEQSEQAPSASNQWAVSPERTAGGSVIGLIDPHVPFHGMYRWYVCHLQAPDFDFHGYCLNGGPLPVLGLTDHHFWAATAGGIDPAACYEEKLNPENPDQYWDGGNWQNVTRRDITVEVERDGRAETETRTLEWTPRGPLVHRNGDTGYSLRTTYDDIGNMAAQVYRMIKARSLDEYRDALGMLLWPNMNLLYGDVDGNIYWVCNGRAPVRSQRYNWREPVPAWEDDTDWHGRHDFEDLPQIINPPAGWLQNCNVAPVHVTPDSGLAMDNFPGIDAAIDEDAWNARGTLASRFLRDADNLSPEQAMGIAFNLKAVDFDHWLERFRAAWDAHPRDDDTVQHAADILLQWDGRASSDSVGATIYHLWRRHLSDLCPHLGGDIEKHPSPWPPDCQANAVQALAEAVDQLLQFKGKVEVPWGEVIVLRRGGKTWPLAGGSGPPETMRASGFGEFDQEVGGMVVEGGATCTTIVEMTQPPKAWCTLPYGQSDDPDSPHFDDWAETYSAGEFWRLT